MSITQIKEHLTFCFRKEKELVRENKFMVEFSCGSYMILNGGIFETAERKRNGIPGAQDLAEDIAKVRVDLQVEHSTS